MGHRSRSFQGKRTDSELQSEYDQNLDFTSSTTNSAGSSFDKGSVVFQIRSKMKCSLDVVFHSNLFVNSFEELEKYSIFFSNYSNLNYYIILFFSLLLFMFKI